MVRCACGEVLGIHGVSGHTYSHPGKRNTVVNSLRHYQAAPVTSIHRESCSPRRTCSPTGALTVAPDVGAVAKCLETPNSSPKTHYGPLRSLSVNRRQRTTGPALSLKQQPYGRFNVVNATNACTTAMFQDRHATQAIPAPATWSRCCKGQLC